MTEQTPPAPIEAEMLVYLGEDNVAKYSVVQGEYIIGRDKSCQVFIDADGVSRHHARLTLMGYELTIEDLGSSNGVFIEGVQIQLPTRVRPDQQIEIGSSRVFIRLKAESSERLEAALWDPDLGLAPVRAMLEGKKYKVMGSIGRGGMGVVHLARDLRVRRSVAMKVIKTASQFSRENVLRFVDEAQLTGQLQHPNIVPVYELGLDEQGEVFYTMKYVKGTTLEQVLRQIQEGDREAIKKYRLDTLLIIFQKICDAVAYAHSMGVVHRDLKPDNVMIGEYGEVLVMDWGLAKKVASGMHDEHLGDTEPVAPPKDLRGFETLNGLIVGTPPYISPEAARGDLDQISPRSDIYVLGAILYAVLTLRAPYPGKEFGELIEQIVSGQFAHPTSYSQPIIPRRTPETPSLGADGANPALAHLPNRRVPDGLSAIVLKAMAYNSEDRYATVEELQADILAWQGGFAPKAERAGLGRQIFLWAWRHKTNVALLGIFFILFNVAVVLFFLSVSHERDRARDSERIAKESEQKLSRALVDLRGVAPIFADEARAFIASKSLDRALGRIDAAIRQLPNEADYHSLRGNVLQTLLRWEEAEDAYEEALERNPKLEIARENLELTRELIAQMPEDREPTTAQIRKLEAALVKQQRMAEASTLIDKFGPERPLVLKALRDALDADPKFAPLREAFKAGKFRGRFQRQPDGTYSADLRGVPSLAIPPLLKNQVLTISSVFLDDVNVQDLSILEGLPLTKLSLNGCTSVADLAPLSGMRIEILNLTRTGVTDLTPLAGMPLVELNLEGCTRIADFQPLKTFDKLERLLLPRHARNIGFVADMPNLKFVSFKSLSQTKEDFFKELGEKKGPMGRPGGKLPAALRPKLGPQPGPPPGPAMPPGSDAPPKAGIPPASPPPPKAQD